VGTIKKNFVYNLVLTVSNIIFPIVTFPYASRILGPEGIGKVQFVNTFAVYFVLMAALGIPIYGIREVAKLRNEPEALKRLITELITLNFFISMIMLVLYTIIVYSSPVLYADRHFYAIAAVMLVLGCFNIDWLYSGLERFRFIAARSVIIKAASVLVLFLLVRDNDDDVYYLAITVGGVVFNNLWNMWSARHYLDFRNLVYQQLKIHYKPLLYIFSTVAAISVYAILDTIILGFLTDFVAVGYYTAASRIIKITIPVLTALGTVLIPQMAAAFKENNLDHVKDLANHSMSFVISLGLPMTIGLIALAPELIILFSGQQFAAAILPMQLFAPVLFIIGLSNVWSVQILMPAGKDKYVTIAAVLGLVSSLLLNFILVPRFSYIGATIANVLTETVVMCALIFYATKVVKVPFNIKLSLATLGISATFFPIVFLVRRVFNQDILICVVSVILCGIVYIGFQLFIIKNKIFMELADKVKVRFNI
jgi:O-antigen/teichoic acid export membrane protein